MYVYILYVTIFVTLGLYISYSISTFTHPPSIHQFHQSIDRSNELGLTPLSRSAHPTPQVQVPDPPAALLGFVDYMIGYYGEPMDDAHLPDAVARARESGRKLAEEAAPKMYTRQKRRIKNQGGQLLNYICRLGQPSTYILLIYK